MVPPCQSCVKGFLFEKRPADHKTFVTPLAALLTLITVVLILASTSLLALLVNIQLSRELDVLKQEVQLIKLQFYSESGRKLEDPENLRVRRQADWRAMTLDGVPVIHEEYGNRSDSEGLRLYESLIESQGRGEPRSPDVTWEGTNESPIKPHHRVSSVWTQSVEEVPQSGDDETEEDEENESVMMKPTKKKPSKITPKSLKSPSEREYTLQRKSRVKIAAYHSQSSGRRMVPVSANYVDDNAERSGQHHEFVQKEMETVTPPPHLGELPPLNQKAIQAKEIKRRQRNRNRKKISVDMPSGVVEFEEGRDIFQHQLPSERPSVESREVEVARGFVIPRRSIGVHFVGDISSYSLQHPHYHGNGRLRNVEATFSDWKPASWSEKLGFVHSFPLDGGEVTIKEGGLYLVYSQIHYVDDHDVNGYEIRVNGVPYLKCVVTSGAETRSNTATCYTGGVVLLRAGDLVSVRDLDVGRLVVLHAPNSFFGLVRLSDAQMI